VAGYIRQWKIKKSEGGRDISQVEKISSASDREEILAILREKEGVHQINFY